MLLGALILVAAAQMRLDAAPQAQVFPSSTPAQVVLPSASSLPTQEGAPPTLPPTFTLEAATLVQLQAREAAGDVNVREEVRSETLGDVLGTIRFGELYPVLGRYFRWLQIEYPSSPTRVGWVFEELVEIVGDEAAIPDLTQTLIEPTIDPIIAAPTQTIEALLQVPGGLQTATGAARVIEAPSVNNGGAAIPGGLSAAATIIPTFTFPPALIAQQPTAAPQGTTGTSPAQPSTSTDTITPIVPIFILMGTGLLGLLVSSIRR